MVAAEAVVATVTMDTNAEMVVMATTAAEDQTAVSDVALHLPMVEATAAVAAVVHSDSEVTVEVTDTAAEVVAEEARTETEVARLHPADGGNITLHFFVSLSLLLLRQHFSHGCLDSLISPLGRT